MSRNYTNTANPSFNSPGASALIRSEFAAISAGFAGLEAELDAAKFATNPQLEWINPARIPAYVSGTQFRWSGSDISPIMLAHRRVRCTVNGAYVYSEVVSAVFSGGITTVTLLDSILTSLLTAVEYSSFTPYGSSSSSLSLVQLDSRYLIAPTFTGPVLINGNARASKGSFGMSQATNLD